MEGGPAVPRLAGGRELADLLELPAVQDPALGGLVEGREGAFLPRGNDFLDGDRTDAGQRFELFGGCGVEIDQPAAANARAARFIRSRLLAARRRRLGAE